MRLLRLLAVALAIFAALAAFAGCSGGGGGGQTDSQNGKVVVSVTDAPGDFTAYDVRIVDVKLTRPNGAAVQTLPVNARVDFNSLTQTTEIIAVGAVPQGEYTGVTLRLDYSDAQVWVERDGAPVKAVTVDGAGNPLGIVEMPVTFDGNARMQVNRGRMKDMTLDFNLAATNSVDLVPAIPVVTVNPFLVAEIEPRGPKGSVARGPLLGTDQAGGFFTLGIRPREAQGDLGEIDILVDSATIYEVDGARAEGAEGFALLAAKGVGTAVVAEGRMGGRGQQLRGGMQGGSMDGGNGNGNGGNGTPIGQAPEQADRGFLAARVRAGTSVQGGDRDALRGTVTARVGAILTVAGGVIDREEGSIFGATVSVVLGEETSVTRDGVAAPGTIADISVGQKISVLGSYDSQAVTMDATGGSVRMEYTRTAGTVKEAIPPEGSAGGLIVADLQRLGGLAPVAFDFSGTGTGVDEDADPAAYEIATASFDLADLLPGDPVIAVGFPAPFGAAAPDFNAVSLIDMSEAAAELNLGWMPPSVSAITEISSNSLLAHTEGTGIMRSVRFGDAAMRFPEGTSVLVTVVASDAVSLAITDGINSPAVYTDFASFAASLSAKLAEGKAVAALFARGSYEPTGTIFTADRIAVRLH